MAWCIIRKCAINKVTEVGRLSRKCQSWIQAVCDSSILTTPISNVGETQFLRHFHIAITDYIAVSSASCIIN